MNKSRQNTEAKNKIMKPIIIENKTTEIIQNQIKTTTTVQILLYRKNKNNSFQIN